MTQYFFNFRLNCILVSNILFCVLLFLFIPQFFIIVVWEDEDCWCFGSEDFPGRRENHYAGKMQVYKCLSTNTHLYFAEFGRYLWIHWNILHRCKSCEPSCSSSSSCIEIKLQIRILFFKLYYRIKGIAIKQANLMLQNKEMSGKKTKINDGYFWKNETT